MKKIMASLILIAGMAAASDGFAQDYLTQPIKIIVPTGAGTIADTVARLMSQDLAARLKQPFVVEDRVGANGVVAARYVAGQPPDGTTFIVGNVSTHAADEFLYHNLGYDPQKDFAPVSLVGYVPQVLVVSNNLPVKTFADFVKLAKQKPGSLNFASASSLTVVAMDVITHGMGIETVNVPFGATPQALNEMMAGRIDAMVVDLGVSKSLIDAGKIRPLLVTMSERSPLLPNLPSLPEVGLAKLDIEGWSGWFAPKGTPPAALNRISDGLRTAAANQDYRNKMSALGFYLTGGGPEELTRFVAQQRAMYQQLIKEAGIPME